MEVTSKTRNVSVKVLSAKTKAIISELLNPQMFLPTPNGILRYWLGLAGLCNIPSIYEASLVIDSDPTKKVLNLWTEKDPEHSTVHQFIIFLEQMDRFDAIEDIIQLLDQDIRIHLSNPRGSDVTHISLDADKYIITTDDVIRISEGRALENYDAFLLFDQNDVEFANLVLENIEKKYNMRFVVKDRDLVGGGLEMDKIITLITERCNRVIVILSDAFFKSSVNDYFVKFAQAYGIESNRKIIPITYKELTARPAHVRYLFTLNYIRHPLYFWDRLRNSFLVVDPAKVKIERSKSDNGQTISSAEYLTSLDAILEAPLMNHSTSADNNLETVPRNKKEKKKWLKKWKGLKKDKNSLTTRA